MLQSGSASERLAESSARITDRDPSTPYGLRFAQAVLRSG